MDERGDKEKDGERGAGGVNKLPLSPLCAKKKRKPGSRPACMARYLQVSVPKKLAPTIN